MTSSQRLFYAWSADTARSAGLPGQAEKLEQQLSEAMVADYNLFLSQDAERHIAEHHRRRPRFRR